MKKRIVAMFLAVCFIVTLLPTAAFAAGDADTSLTVNVNQGQTLEQAVEQLENENLSSIETLNLDTEDGVMLTITDINYIKQNFTGLQTLDLTDADFIDDQGQNNPNWIHPWKGTTENIEHQFPDCAFSSKNYTQLKKVIFGSKIKSIGAFAFSGCTTLQDVQFVGSSLEVIDNDAFAGTQLTAIDMPETVSYLGYGVFRHTNLVEVKIPSQVKEIKYQTFADCSQLTKVDLGSVETIGGMEWGAPQNAVFLRCTNLKSIQLPKTLQELGGEYTHVFNGCDIIVDATANPEIAVGQYAFAGGSVQQQSVECKAFVYLQRETQNVTANEKIGVAITNGGTFANNAVFTNGALAEPKKRGYAFEGWYEDAEFTGDKVTTAEANKTYYAKYTEAEEPDEEVSSGSTAGTDAAVILGGAAISAAAYFVGTQIWMETHLPDGVIPTNREQLALMLWNAAGRPQPAETALYADISAEAADTQLAARWCVEQGLMKDYGESFKPGKYTFRPQVIKAWNQLQKLG